MTAAEDTSAEVIAAMQAALAGEHACVYGYGVVGAHLGDEEQTRARRALAAHEARRDDLRGVLLARGAEPEAALAGYALPFPVDDAASARDLAAVLEERLAAVYLDVVATGPDEEVRRFAADALIDAAVREAAWSGEAKPFPGLSGRAGAPGSLDGDERDPDDE